jgi:hypothetical protein
MGDRAALSCAVLVGADLESARPTKLHHEDHAKSVSMCGSGCVRAGVGLYGSPTPSAGVSETPDQRLLKERFEKLFSANSLQLIALSSVWSSPGGST